MRTAIAKSTALSVSAARASAIAVSKMKPLVKLIVQPLM